MSTKSISKEEAIRVQLALITLYKDKSWFTKVALSSDDLGWSLDLYCDVPAMHASGGEIPRDLGDIKICLFNTNK